MASNQGRDPPGWPLAAHCKGVSQEIMPNGNEFRLECIIAEKVYNECTICECPTFRVSVAPFVAVSVEECEVDNIMTTASIPEENVVQVTITFDLTLRFTDSNGMQQEVTRQQTFSRRFALPGARPGMNVIVIPPRIECLTTRISNGGTVIEADVGIWTIIKVTAFVQLQVSARFCPQPPECEEVEPFGCPDWPEQCERFFQELFPPQPTPPPI